MNRKILLALMCLLAWRPAPLPAQNLPDGPGKAEVESNCSTCHNLNRVVNHRDSLEGWTAIVDQMVGYGAMFTETDTKLMAQYLYANFSDKAPEGKPAEPAAAPANEPQSQSGGAAPVPNAIDVKLPEGVAKQWVEESCVQCHALSRIASAGHTREEWANVVEDMIRRGATLTPNKVDSLIDYLAAVFPKKSPQPEVKK